MNQYIQNFSHKSTHLYLLNVSSNLLLFQWICLIEAVYPYSTIFQFYLSIHTIFLVLQCCRYSYISATVLKWHCCGFAMNTALWHWLLLWCHKGLWCHNGMNWLIHSMWADLRETSNNDMWFIAFTIMEIVYLSVISLYSNLSIEQNF